MRWEALEANSSSFNCQRLCVKTSVVTYIYNQEDNTSELGGYK